MSEKGVAREPVWTDAELAYLRERYGSDSGREIAAVLNRTPRAVFMKALKEGLSTRESPRPWTDADTAYLVEHYENTPTLEIAKTLGRRHATIKVHADQLGLLSIKRRANAAIRHDYFAVVDSPLKAYILGLFASDGWIKYDGNELGIKLHQKDGHLVELVRDELAPLTAIMPRQKTQLEFRISSGQMKADLARCGVTPRKSLTLQWPAVLPGRLENSFILGCFDGDGCLWHDRKRGYYAWSLVSASRAFLEEVKARVLAHTGVKLLGPYGTSSGSRALRIAYAGPRTRLLDEWLHADVGGLARKRPT